MTAADPARALVALPGWRWLPGMLAVYPGRDRSPYGEARLSWTVTDDGERAEYMGLDYVGAFPTWGCPSEGSGWLPDLSDSATAGCLLALLGEVSEYTDCFRVHEDGGTHWAVYHCMPDGSVQPATGPTLGAACAAALCAIGRCE